MPLGARSALTDACTRGLGNFRPTLRSSAGRAEGRTVSELLREGLRKNPQQAKQKGKEFPKQEQHAQKRQGRKERSAGGPVSLVRFWNLSGFPAVAAAAVSGGRGGTVKSLKWPPKKWNLRKQ